MNDGVKNGLCSMAIQGDSVLLVESSFLRSPPSSCTTASWGLGGVLGT